MWNELFFMNLDFAEKSDQIEFTRSPRWRMSVLEIYNFRCGNTLSQPFCVCQDFANSVFCFLHSMSKCLAKNMVVISKKPPSPFRRYIIMSVGLSFPFYSFIASINQSLIIDYSVVLYVALFAPWSTSYPRSPCLPLRYLLHQLQILGWIGLLSEPHFLT